MGPVLPGEHVPRRDDRRRQRSEIGEQQPSHLLDRIRGETDGVLEHRLLGLKGLLQATAGLVVEPAVIRTADATIFEESVVQRSATVETLLPD